MRSSAIRATDISLPMARYREVLDIVRRSRILFPLSHRLVFSKKRVMEFLKANACLARYIRPGDTSAFQPLNYQLAHMDAKFVGAGSPANMASTPAAWVIGDEAAKWPHVNKDEAPPMQLLMERTKAFPRRFHMFCSTPTTVENEFWQGFLSADMRQYFVPCPHCGGEFVFKFSRDTVRWDKPENGVTDIDLAAATVRYICPHCQGEIYEDEKPAMRGCTCRRKTASARCWCGGTQARKRGPRRRRS